MINFLYTILIALANNLDNISVRIAYSIRGIKISILKNIWISVITFIISAGAAYSGSLVLKYLNKEVSNWLTLILLCGIGLWIILEPYLKNKKDKPNLSDTEEINPLNVLIDPEKGDMDKSNDIDFKEATFLGIALSLNNVGGGVSAGVIGLNFIFVGLLSAVISFLSLWLGNYITDFLNKWDFGKKANIIAGIVLIIIGIVEFIR